MKKFSILMAVICVIAIGYSLHNIYAIPQYIQVQNLSPEIEKIEPNKKVATELFIGEKPISAENSGTNANLRAVDFEYFGTYFMRLIDGRLFYNNEEDHTAIIDKAVALNLFPSVSPIGRQIKIDEKTYKVVGVIEKSPYTMYNTNVFIPFKTAQIEKLKGKFIIDSIDTKKESRSEFLEGKSNDGMWDITKEREKSILLFKICTYILIVYLINRLRRELARFLKNRFAELQRLNMNKYPSQFWLNILLFVIQCILGYGFIVAVLAGGVYHLVQSAVMIPEYIPEILVDFGMIKQKYLENIKASSTLYYLRTDVMIMIQYYAHIINTAFVLFLISISSKLFIERKNTHE